MENRLVIAYALCAIMALILAVIAVRYVYNRKRFKARQSGRGKNSESPGSSVDNAVPAE